MKRQHFCSPTPVRRGTRTLLVFAAASLFALGPVARAADAKNGFEQLLGAAQQDKRSVTLYIGAQTVGGAVLRIEPGQWVELRNQQYARIVVRLDRIDALAQQ